MSISSDLGRLSANAVLEKQAFLSKIPNALRSLRSGAHKLFGGLTGHGTAMARLGQERGFGGAIAQDMDWTRNLADLSNWSPGKVLPRTEEILKRLNKLHPDRLTDPVKGEAYLKALTSTKWPTLTGRASLTGPTSPYPARQIRAFKEWIKSEKALEAARKFENRTQWGAIGGMGGSLGLRALLKNKK